MWRQTWMTLIMVAQLACEQSDDPPGSSGCAARTGLYRAVFVQRDGNCGPVSEQVVNASAPLPAGCTARLPVDLQACQVQTDTTCPVDGQPGATVTVRGSVTWDASATRGTGVLQFVIQSPNDFCSSTYNVTYTRL